MRKRAPRLVHHHGVSIWNYQPTMLHAKLMTVDGHGANIGSANLNRPSFCFDEEIDIVALEPGLVATWTTTSKKTSTAACASDPAAGTVAR